MEIIFQKELKNLTDTQVSFLCDIIDKNKDELMGMDEQELDDVYDILCDMEVDELSKAGDDDISDVGKIVSDIVTLFGNAIAESRGYLDESGDI